MKTISNVICTLIILLLVLISAAEARIWLIQPDGTGDAPTIQAGIDSASAGDFVELASGTFTGLGNRNIDFKGKAITVCSQNHQPESCVIDCQQAGKGFNFLSGEGLDSVLEGVTITNGNTDPGGAVRCWSGSGPTIRNCIFADNSSSMIGGAIAAAAHSSPTIRGCTFLRNSSTFGGAVIGWVDGVIYIEDCTFIDNYAWFGGAIEAADRANIRVSLCSFWLNSAERGGAIMSEEDGSVELANCTFFENSAEQTGAGVQCESVGHVYLTNCIIAFGTSGEAVAVTGSSDATLVCCDLFGNDGGDWVGPIAPQFEIEGNIRVDPLFCYAQDGDFTLADISPCLPGNHPSGADCDVIGRFGSGCLWPTGVPQVEVETISWGAVKALYR